MIPINTFRHQFKNKKSNSYGFGLLGRDVGDASSFAECGAQVTVTDTKTKEQLQPSLKKLTRYNNISYTLGGHSAHDFTDADLIVKSSGITLDNSFRYKRVFKE